MTANEVLSEFQNWYNAQCNGEWENNHGIDIDTLDNPGWIVQIDIEGTSHEKVDFSEVHDVDSEVDWMHCRVRDERFEIACSALRLEEGLRVFLDWVRDG